jgi:hypothetical protein
VGSHRTSPRADGGRATVLAPTLQHDDVWWVEASTELTPDASGTVPRRQLMEGGAKGGANEDIFTTVRSDRRFLQQLEEVVADLLQPDVRQQATSALLWDGWAPRTFATLSVDDGSPPEQLAAYGHLDDADVLLLVRDGQLIGIGDVLWRDPPAIEGAAGTLNIVWHGLDRPIELPEIERGTELTFPQPATSGPRGARRVPNTLVRMFQNRFQEHLPAGSPLTYEGPPEARSVWLFQGNPQRFEGMAEHLATAQPGDVGRWSVSRYADEMQAGDLLLLWISGPEAGIYALGELVHIPYLAEENDFGDTFVDYRYLDVLDPPLRREDLRQHPVLQDLGVLRFPQGTNYRVTEEQWLALEPLLDRGEAVDEDAIHLLFKWSTDIEARTIELHRQVAVEKGAVWWGKFGTPGGRAVLSERNLELIRTQLLDGTTTFAFLYRPGEVWRTRLEEITVNPDEVDRALLPGYYDTDECNLFVRISGFEKLEPDHATRYLVLASDPDPDRMPGALGNQRTPLLVRELAGPAPPKSTPPARTMEWLEDRTKWHRDELDELIGSLRGPSPQVILAGPPGTGKTHVAKYVAEYLTQNRALAVRTVQFHPSYSYEEFVEGLRPVAEDGELTFRVKPGIVREIVEAIGDEDHEPYVLIIDEMNRANLSRVFGELLYLFEYRSDPIQLQHTADFELPTNLAFIGTMNTADRSIRSIDIALRRRFEVFECSPSAEILRRFYDEHPERANHLSDLIEGFEKLNAELTERLDRHHTIGHTFFMTDEMTPGHLQRVWRRQLGPLIEEYFFDQPDVAAEFGPERFWELE